MQRPANSSGKEGELAAMAGRQSEEELANLQASVRKFHAAIAEHGKVRDVQKKERAELDGKQKVLAEKKLAYNRLLQQQQNLMQRSGTRMRQQAKKLEAQLALIAEEQAEYHRIEKTAVGSYDEVRQRLDATAGEEERSSSAERGARVCHTGDRRSHRTGRQAAGTDQGPRRGRAEEGRAHRTSPGRPRRRGDRGGPARRGGQLPARGDQQTEPAPLPPGWQHYQEEREKIAADQKTIRDAGADGVCPLCRQKLGEHFGSIEAEFSTRLQDLEEQGGRRS